MERVSSLEDTWRTPWRTPPESNPGGHPGGHLGGHLRGHLGGHIGGHPWRTPRLSSGGFLRGVLQGGHPPHFIYLSKTLFTLLVLYLNGNLTINLDQGKQ
jgi:hypothetical protein